MRIFAKTTSFHAGGVPSHLQPPSGIMESGFLPPSRGHLGSPIVAQWFNHLFQQLTLSSGFAINRAGRTNQPVEFENIFRFRDGAGNQVVKAFEVRWWADDGSLANRRTIWANYNPGTSVTLQGGVQVTASKIIIPTSLIGGYQMVTIKPFTEAP